MPFEIPEAAPLRASGGAASLRARVVPLTDIGRKRKNNEDNYLVLPLDGEVLEQTPEELSFSLSAPGLLLAVADGMGGHQCGEVASRLCVENLGEEIFKRLPEDSGPDVDPYAAIEEAVEATHQIIYQKSQTHPALEGMGSTLTAALIRGQQLTLAQVGDSRAYLIREGRLNLLTEDQTVGNLLRAQEISSQTAPINDVLTQAMGAQAGLQVVTSAAEMAPRDVLLLCSDGLYKVVSPDEILEIVQPLSSMRTKAEHLIQRANENGGPDNITVVVAEIFA
ncbi:MAG TPA: PP2C family serine/threonine-protein phosphatase [Terriglobia bacterium]|nr:PP2C family serine/threonine-protein phosphatase [Terriglobia bacterium]